MKKTWTIYRHVNKTNGKCYIGITCQRWERCRWGRDGHGYNQPGQKKFWAAIVKYGWNNFDHEKLERGIKTPDEANARETYWIKFYDSFRNGYNATTGGSGSTGHILSNEKKKEMGKANIGTKHHTQKHSDESKKKMSEQRKGKHYSSRTEFKKGMIPWAKGLKGKFGKSVIQYDVDGNFIKEWPNVYSVVQYFGGKSQSCLRQCCKRNRKRYKGFIWRFKEDTIEEKVEPQELIDVRMPVLQYDKSGVFIAEYGSTIEAYRKTGVNRGTIQKCCKGIYKQAGGYVWKHK